MLYQHQPVSLLMFVFLKSISIIAIYLSLLGEHDSKTYTVGTAMQNYLKSLRTTDLFEFRKIKKRKLAVKRWKLIKRRLTPRKCRSHFQMVNIYDSVVLSLQMFAAEFQ